MTAQSVPSVFGHRLRAERETQGLTLRQLGAKSGVNASTVLHAEQGHDVRLSIAAALASALGLPLAALLAEPACARCGGNPGPGFMCLACGRTCRGAARTRWTGCSRG
jgi:transcriptional regulator with XRE-family HTH domain